MKGIVIESNPFKLKYKKEFYIYDQLNCFNVYDFSPNQVDIYKSLIQSREIISLYRISLKLKVTYNEI